MNDTESIKSSTFPDTNIQPVKDGQMMLPVWGLLVTLLLIMIVLKLFIYIKDEKRDGK